MRCGSSSQRSRGSWLSRVGSRRRAQQAAMARLPGQGFSRPMRLGAGLMILVEVSNYVVPLVQQAQADTKDANVGIALRDIAWWQERGLTPSMSGVEDATGPLNYNEPTSDSSKVGRLLAEGDLEYLALTSLDHADWVGFKVWASAVLKNYRVGNITSKARGRFDRRLVRLTSAHSSTASESSRKPPSASM